MAKYKEARYKPSKNYKKELWLQVDTYLQISINYYSQVSRDKNSPSFIDLIIKLNICRAYVNIRNKKLLTAEKILENSRKLILMIVEGKLRVQAENREGAAVIPTDILYQKYLLQKGFLSIDLNKEQDACVFFTDCLRSGKDYDPRIRRECVIQLRNIFSRHGQVSDSLEKMMKSFNHRNKDIVFLVNISESMKPYLENDVKEAL